MHKGWVIWWAAVAVCVIAACGCGRSGGSGANQSNVTVINYWNGFTGPDGTTMTKMVEDFEKANPDIQVKIQIIPWSTYYDKLTLSLAYGGAPDVFIVEAARFPQFAYYHTLRPLSDLIASDKVPLSAKDFSTKPWDECFWQGKQVALPLGTFPIGLYYNTKLFKDAGIVDSHGNAQPPSTLAEFLVDAKKLTKDTTGSGRIDQWGFVYTNQHTNWLTFAHQYGGDILTPNGRVAAMSSPASLQATQLMTDLIYKYHVAPKPEGVDPWLAFRQGKVGMAMEGLYMLTSLQDDQTLQFSGAPVPQFGPIKGIWGGSHLLCEPAGISPAQARAGWRLIRYLSDHSVVWSTAGQVPARLDALNSSEFRSLTVQNEFASQIPYLIYEPQIPKSSALNQFIDPAIEAALLQLQDPKDAMVDADRRIDQVLARP